MTLNRMAKTRDLNEARIVDGLRNIPGVHVYLLDQPCDVLIGFRNVIYLMEFKSADRKVKLTLAQERFKRDWPGYVHVVRTLREAVEVLGIGTDPPHSVDCTGGDEAA